MRHPWGATGTGWITIPTRISGGREAHTAESAASGPGRLATPSRVGLQMIGLALPPWIGAGCDSRDFRGRVSTLSGQSGQRLSFLKIDFLENGASRFDRFFICSLLVSYLTLYQFLSKSELYQVSCQKYMGTPTIDIWNHITYQRGREQPVSRKRKF